MALSLGVILIVAGIFRLKNEPRRFSNAVCLSTGTWCIVKGGQKLWNRFFPGLSVSNGNYELTRSGTIQGNIFMIGMLLMVLLGIVLLITGIQLLRKERLCVAHVLPIAFAVFCLLFPIISMTKPIPLSGTISDVALTEVLLFIRSCAMYVPFMIATYVMYAVIYVLARKEKMPDYIVVLGARIIDQRVSPLLARRLDKAAAIYEKYNGAPMLIVSGGQGSDEKCSEASAMKNYLLEKGLPEEKILLEDQSTNTAQNIRFSRKIIEERTKKPYHCALVTNNYHVLRSVIWARVEGLPCSGYGCKTAAYYAPAAALREAIAFIFAYKKLTFIAVGLFASKAVITIYAQLLLNR